MVSQPVGKILRTLAQLWPSGGRWRAPVPFQVVCRCGRLLSGWRKRQHQVLICPQCRAEVFVLPASPLPPPAADSRLPGPAAGRVLPLVWLLGVGLAGGLLLATAAMAVVLYLGRFPVGQVASLDRQRTELESHRGEGESALADGRYHLAVEALTRAKTVADRHPSLLTVAERRRLAQLSKEAALLADLLTESLEEILGRAAGMEATEWQRVFERRYRGKSFLLDSRIRKEPTGEIALLDYRLLVAAEKARIELRDVQLLHQIPLTNPQRVILGVRLASARREAMGEWLVRLEPDSGVLLTVPGALASCSSIPIDEELRAILYKQEDWTADLP